MDAVEAQEISRLVIDVIMASRVSALVLFDIGALHFFIFAMFLLAILLIMLIYLRVRTL